MSAVQVFGDSIDPLVTTSRRTLDPFGQLREPVGGVSNDGSGCKDCKLGTKLGGETCECIIARALHELVCERCDPLVERRKRVEPALGSVESCRDRVGMTGQVAIEALAKSRLHARE